MEKYLMSSSQRFDYSILDSFEKDKIIEKENVLMGIYSRYSKDVGKVLLEAQDILSNKGNGTFEKWYRSLGFKKQNVHNYINIYKNVQNLDEPEQEIFEGLSKSLKIEMSKPSAIPKANEAVFNGDIKTHKEYKALEKKLKQEQLEREKQAELIKALENREPEKEVVEKKVEVVPEDYNNLKSDNEQLAKANSDLNSKLKKLTSDLEFMQSKYNLLESNTREAKQLEATIKRLKGEKDRIQSLFDLSDKTKAINEFFDKEMASIRFKPLVDVIQSEQAFNDLKETVSIVDHWVEEMREILPDTYIREAEIVEE